MTAPAVLADDTASLVDDRPAPASPTRAVDASPADAPPDAAASAAPGAATDAVLTRFIAVSGQDVPEELDPIDRRHAERRAVERRMDDVAVRSTIANLPTWSAVVGIATLAASVLALLRDLTSGALWSLAMLGSAALVAGLPWWLRRGRATFTDTRPMQRAIAGLSGLAVAVLAVAPWWLQWSPSGRGGAAGAGGAAALFTSMAEATSSAQLLGSMTGATGLWAGLFAVLCAAVALAGASTLAPLVRIGLIPTLLPLSPALAGALGAPNLSVRVAWLAAGAASVGAALLVLRLRHRVWRQNTRALIEQGDRIRDLEGERDDAWRADQEKSRFLAIASHDLRQPVHALGLFAATLEKRVQGTPEEPLVRNVMRAIDGLERSFNAMLDISRLDAGTMEPNRQTFPLRDTFRRLHMHFAGQAELAGLGLRFSPGGKSVTSDPQLLERVLGNLIQNAIKYTEHGGIVVVARSTSTHINVEIWDTGAGISPKELPRIFDEFYQIGRGERDRAHGLGMGLAIVKRLVRLLGCSLVVASRPGKGTMFRVGIPLGGLPGIQEALVAADTVPMKVQQPRMVLVIDDEEPIREGLRMLLEEWGFQTVTAADAELAEQAVATLDAKVDLIVSDLHLGDGPDGLDAIANVRRRYGYEVPAILVTGDTSHEEIRRVTDSGHPVLFKPVQPRKLFDMLRDIVG